MALISLLTGALPVYAADEDKIEITEQEITQAAIEMAFPEGTDLNFELRDDNIGLTRNSTGEKVLIATEKEGNEVEVTTIMPYTLVGERLVNSYQGSSNVSVDRLYQSFEICGELYTSNVEGTDEAQCFVSDEFVDGLKIDVSNCLMGRQQAASGTTPAGTRCVKFVNYMRGDGLLTYIKVNYSVNGTPHTEDRSVYIVSR